MNKIVIIYASVHHHNTEKVINYIASSVQADVINILQMSDPDIRQYEFVFFASGIYFQSLHKSLLQYMEQTSFAGKKTALFYTCGIPYKDYAKSAVNILIQKKAMHMGSFHCRGFDTYGPLGKIGGIAKNHPNQRDLDRMLGYAKKIIEEPL